MTPVLRHQLHLWLSDADYAYLKRTSEEAEMPIGMIVRTLIKRAQRDERRHAEIKAGRGPERARDADD